MTRNITISIQPLTAVITPYAMARIADDLFRMANGFESENEVSLGSYFVLCASVEIGLKSAILAHDCTDKKKTEIKALGHDLVKIHSYYTKIYDEIFDQYDIEAIARINPFFKKKGLEYFTIDLLTSALEGFEALPDLGAVKDAARKVNHFLTSSAYFIDAKTSERAKRGIINFA